MSDDQEKEFEFESTANENITEEDRADPELTKTHMGAQMNISASLNDEQSSAHQRQSANDAQGAYGQAFGGKQAASADYINYLAAKYVNDMPVAPDDSKSAERQKVLANAASGKYSKELNDAILEEQKRKEQAQQQGAANNKSDSPENKNTNNGMPLPSFNLFGGVKEALRRKPLTEQLVNNNLSVRNHAYNIDRAVALNQATQSALTAHLSTLNFDTNKAMRDMKNQVASPEATQLLNDSTAQSLIADNDVATRNLAEQLNPRNLKETQAIINDGNLDSSLGDKFKESIAQGSDALERNLELPTNDDSIRAEIAEAIKKFVESLKAMFGISDNKPEQSMGMGR